MKPANLKAATHNAERRARTAVEQVKAAEKKARAAKEKTWRAKLLFKLARRASKKAKKAAKRARAKAVRAQIALKELTEPIAPATRLSGRSTWSDPMPRRNAPMKPPKAAARRKPSAGEDKVGVGPLRALARQRPAQIRSDATPMKAKTAGRSAKTSPRAIEEVKQTGGEFISTRPGAPDEPRGPTDLRGFGEARISTMQPPPESPVENPGS